jgi:putative Mg2+ transporter-C (MgtC) family protein
MMFSSEFISPQTSLGDLLSGAVPRLALSAFLGGLIGLERQIKRRPAGLRTNMFICFGAALYTILSFELTRDMGPGDHTRIAAQIIPGIGFIGAGCILHAKSGVAGLTTAATLFVVASIGMACGGGLYWPATFATLMIFIGLLLLGWVETQFNLKPLCMNYVVEASKPADSIIPRIQMLLHLRGKSAQGVFVADMDGQAKILFSVEGTRKEQKEILDHLRQSADLRQVEVSPGQEPGE